MDSDNDNDSQRGKTVRFRAIRPPTTYVVTGWSPQGAYRGDLGIVKLAEDGQWSFVPERGSVAVVHALSEHDLLRIAGFIRSLNASEGLNTLGGTSGPLYVGDPGPQGDGRG